LSPPLCRPLLGTNHGGSALREEVIMADVSFGGVRFVGPTGKSCVFNGLAAHALATCAFLGRAPHGLTVTELGDPLRAYGLQLTGTPKTRRSVGILQRLRTISFAAHPGVPGGTRRYVLCDWPQIHFMP